MTELPYAERKHLELLEQRRLELAAEVSGIAYLIYMPRSFPHPSGLLYRSAPDARASIWNPLENDGDLFRLALAVPSVNLHEIIAKEHPAGGDVARRVREAFVQAVTGPVCVEELARPSNSGQTGSMAYGLVAANEEVERPELNGAAPRPSAEPDV